MLGFRFDCKYLWKPEPLLISPLSTHVGGWPVDAARVHITPWMIGGNVNKRRSIRQPRQYMYNNLWKIPESPFEAGERWMTKSKGGNVWYKILLFQCCYVGHLTASHLGWNMNRYTQENCGGRLKCTKGLLLYTKFRRNVRCTARQAWCFQCPEAFTWKYYRPKSICMDLGKAHRPVTRHPVEGRTEDFFVQVICTYIILPFLNINKERWCVSYGHFLNICFFCLFRGPDGGGTFNSFLNTKNWVLYTRESKSPCMHILAYPPAPRKMQLHRRSAQMDWTA